MNLNGWRWYRAALLSAGALWCGAGFALQAEDQAPKPKEALRPLPQNQKKLGVEMEGISRQLGELLEEIEANRMGEPALELKKHGASREKLDELSGKTIPKIVDDLRVGELEKGVEKQTDVIHELNTLIKSIKNELGPLDAERELRHAIDLQTKVKNKINANKDKDPGREGKTPHELTPEQRNENKDLAGDQHDVTRAIDDTIAKLKKYGDDLTQDDPGRAKEIGKIVAELERTKPQTASDDASHEIEENRPSNASTKQDDVLKSLNHALANLPGQNDPTKPLENRVSSLEHALDHQTEAGKDTDGLNSKDEDGTNRALDAQGKVTEDVQPHGDKNNPGAKDPVLKALHEKSREINRKIAEGKPDDAHRLQGELTRDIGKALGDAKKQLADAKNQPGKPGQPDGQPGKPGEPGEPGKETAEKTEPSEAKESKEHESGVGTLTYGKLRGAPKEEGWNVQLSAKERADVSQAQAQKFPIRYRKQIEAYYQSLASQ